ncbi:hypothetical protein [Embleya sp. NPDC005971]|uniref:hypothetical protein n=1 Tax=Embleya sp. NPDC005971 TaxID=3156724 RepID=UPI0033DDD1EF
MSSTNPPLDHGNDMQDGYAYPSHGPGVRVDLIEAVLAAWARISPTGDPATTLRSVNDGALNRIDNLARITATAVAVAIERNSGPSHSAPDASPSV